MCGTGTVRVCVRVTSQVKSTGLWTGTRCFGRRNLLRFVLSRATYPHPRVKIATRARPTYLPSPSRRAWSPGPTHLPLATLEKGCNISATKAWVSEGPSSIVGFSGDRSCPFMSIFCLEIAFCAWMAWTFSRSCREALGRSDPCRFMQKACMFALFRPQTYLPTLDVVLPPHARTYLPTLCAYRGGGPT